MKHIKSLIIILSVILLAGCGKNNLLKDTKWTAKDGSEIIFTSDKVSWYESADNHDDNYYKGSYKFYIGKKAANYLTKDLKSYGITSEELDQLYNLNKGTYYKEENLVVIDIRYDEFKLNGEKQEIKNNHVPMFGFVNDEKEYLDVANMNTGTYYGFSKVTK